MFLKRCTLTYILMNKTSISRRFLPVLLLTFECIIRTLLRSLDPVPIFNNTDLDVQHILEKCIAKETCAK